MLSRLLFIAGFIVFNFNWPLGSILEEIENKIDSVLYIGNATVPFEGRYFAR